MKEPVQLDLFAELPPAPAVVEPARRSAPPEALSDAELIAALPEASLADIGDLAAEAGRRRLGDAVPALVAHCQRFAGFGLEHPVPEQIAALAALGVIGGPEASRGVARLIARGIVQGPNLVAAVAAAAALGVKLDPDAVLTLLRHADPAVRAPACDCARANGEVAAALIALLTDRNEDVATAAACALGRAGRAEAREQLKRWLEARPSRRVIEALAAVADEDAGISLGRLGRKRPDLAEAILAGLDEIDDPKAARVAAGLRSWLAKAGR